MCPCFHCSEDLTSSLEVFLPKWLVLASPAANKKDPCELRRAWVMGSLFSKRDSIENQVLLQVVLEVKDRLSQIYI